jgi:uncharacterized repeat protein (TIGR03987 family)
MSSTLLAAVILVTAALGLYSFAVWGEQVTHELRRGFILAFWTGFICDTAGTSLMAVIASESAKVNYLHTGAGLLAIVLMGLHALWAALVWWRQDRHAEELFHRFSRYVYFVWLFAFATGGAMNMSLFSGSSDLTPGQFAQT